MGQVWASSCLHRKFPSLLSQRQSSPDTATCTYRQGSHLSSQDSYIHTHAQHLQLLHMKYLIEHQFAMSDLYSGGCLLPPPFPPRSLAHPPAPTLCYGVGYPLQNILGTQTLDSMRMFCTWSVHPNCMFPLTIRSPNSDSVVIATS